MGPSLVYFSWDLDVHWRYGVLTHGHMSKDKNKTTFRVISCRRGGPQFSVHPSQNGTIGYQPWPYEPR